MDAPNPMTPIQLILIIILLGLLITWMITFLVLALRPVATKRAIISAQDLEDEQISYTSTATPVPPLHNPHSSQNPAPAPVMMHMVAVPPTHSHS